MSNPLVIMILPEFKNMETGFSMIKVDQQLGWVKSRVDTKIVIMQIEKKVLNKKKRKYNIGDIFLIG